MKKKPLGKILSMILKEQNLSTLPKSYLFQKMGEKKGL